MIAVDTAVAHLAGALGRPLWLLLSHIQDWRWMHDRVDSPWYPTARLFRQIAIGDWDSVIAAVAQELAAFGEGRAADSNMRRSIFRPIELACGHHGFTTQTGGPAPAPRLYLTTPPISDASLLPCS